MRNVFDQYSQPENRLTHALATFLNEDREALRGFLRMVGAPPPPGQGMVVLEQRLPGESFDEPEEVSEGRGLPDLWIHDTAMKWAVLVEAKVASGLAIDQLRRHKATAERRGFEVAAVIALTANESTRGCHEWVTPVSWSELYTWARKLRTASTWAGRFTEYLEIAERKMTDDGYLRDGTLTTFAGIPFGAEYPYNYGEAKRVLRLMTERLRKRKDLARAGIDTAHPGRSAITGAKDALVWDYLPLKSARGKEFTASPHVSYSLNRVRVHAALTIPNGLRGPVKSALRSLGTEGFLDLVRDRAEAILAVTRRAGSGARPILYLEQRHYRSQRSRGTEDARMSVDLRTLLPRKASGVKVEPGWVTSLYEIWQRKRSNMQMGIGAEFPYGPETQNESIVDLVAGTWLACEPIWRLK